MGFEMFETSAESQPISHQKKPCLPLSLFLWYSRTKKFLSEGVNCAIPHLQYHLQPQPGSVLVTNTEDIFILFIIFLVTFLYGWLGIWWMRTSDSSSGTSWTQTKENSFTEILTSNNINERHQIDKNSRRQVNFFVESLDERNTSEYFTDCQDIN